MNGNMTLTRTCPRCQTEIKLFMFPEGAMTDPTPAKARLFVVKPCPNCGKKVFFWVGWKQVLK
jgi:endogenous inhibitor of DNA gyrase (YacG/DUF329 family)